MMKIPDLKGLTVATLLPYREDFSIDWDDYSYVLDYCVAPDGVTAALVNGHAGEGGLLTVAERREVVERTRAHIPHKPLLAGIIATSTAEAIAEAKMAEDAGADCAVLFPPGPLGGGASATSRAPVAYVRAVSEAIGIPVSLFQYPVASGYGYSTETLCELAAIEGVIAIKEGSDTMLAYDENWRAVKKASPDVSVLASNYNWFLPQMAVGADGILSGLGSLAPHLFAELWQASAAGDLASMRAVNERLYPIVRAIYGPSPLIDMHTRMKAGLKALGVIQNAAPRPPMMPTEVDIAANIATVVEAARRAGDIRVC
ncbi:dihydrodipicolinate synthase family protein [Phyllobacterium sp. 0TCS1.6C]|uniref:dihydrodipicolinate synthase family protein n=1 Tax=unclassified Phyllobacterium TaxID=2638441 RepID=UPI00226435E7|nr:MULTISPECIES: dihydrodipicolinate synthase family protein [unclassified Phyllobacterium]MCX8281119.1 dihydrodipicolinate synthase family protein [Phyllobacterium sp. 0TCS1.6C]MCX8294594.1 dihydrodipicolinate synthase family protein [Phyllobacterium sp. 0TCS1.6A]